MPQSGLPAEGRQALATWLFVLAGMVVAMIVIGGLTRLTGSGLSMVDWRPVTGWLPPLTEAGWQAAFTAYQATPEYRDVNAGLTLAGFREIFWLEYIHRLWGRLIGVVFAIPFAVFLWKGWIDRRAAPRFAILFVLGGLQGGLGWYMVQSGLVDRPEVSQYRLVAHLGAALVIYAALLWSAFGYRAHPEKPDSGEAPSGHAAVLVAMIFMTVLSGGFVAGLDAGYAYNTFPTMDGYWLPPLLYAADPAWLSAFEDITTVQFNHRVLAIVTAAVAVAFWLRVHLFVADGAVRRAAAAVGVAALAQVGLGIATLLLIVPLPLAAAHQAGAVVLFTAALWAAFTCRRAPVSVPGVMRARPV